MALAPDDEPRGMSGCAIACIIFSGLVILVLGAVAFLVWKSSAEVAPPFIYTL